MGWDPWEQSKNFPPKTVEVVFSEKMEPYTRKAHYFHAIFPMIYEFFDVDPDGRLYREWSVTSIPPNDRSFVIRNIRYETATELQNRLETELKAHPSYKLDVHCAQLLHSSEIRFDIESAVKCNFCSNSIICENDFRLLWIRTFAMALNNQLRYTMWFFSGRKGFHGYSFDQTVDSNLDLYTPLVSRGKKLEKGLRLGSIPRTYASDLLYLYLSNHKHIPNHSQRVLDALVQIKLKNDLKTAIRKYDVESICDILYLGKDFWFHILFDKLFDFKEMVDQPVLTERNHLCRIPMVFHPKGGFTGPLPGLTNLTHRISKKGYPLHFREVISQALETDVELYRKYIDPDFIDSINNTEVASSIFEDMLKKIRYIRGNQVEISNSNGSVGAKRTRES